MLNAKDSSKEAGTLLSMFDPHDLTPRTRTLLQLFPVVQFCMTFTLVRPSSRRSFPRKNVRKPLRRQKVTPGRISTMRYLCFLMWMWKD